MIDPIPIIEVSTGVGCRLNCHSYCPQATHVKNYAARGGDSKMGLDTFERCLEKIPQSVEIQFAGMAEPWLNSWATEMVVRANSTGHKVSIFSTLSGMTLEDVQVVRHIPWRIFCVHLPDKEGKMHLKIDDQYLEVLRAVCDLSPSYMIVGTMPKEVQEIVGQPVADFSHGLYSRAGNLNDRAIPRKTGKLKELPCMHHGVLLPNGDVVLCCQDYGVKSVLGSLLTQSYESLYSGAEFQRILRGLEDENEDIICRNCEVSEKW